MSIEVLATYDERGVAQWIQNLSPKLAPFAPLFVEHQIEGALFLRLDDAMLREMGINRATAPHPRWSVLHPVSRADPRPPVCGFAVIGPRARLLEELSRLKAQQRRVRREAAIWEADQFDGRSDWEKFKACNTCFPLQLDHYKLTSAYLVVKRTHQTMCCCVPVGGVFGSVSQTQNSMDLSLIKDIDTSTVESGACCCATGHDEVYVSTEGPDKDDSETLHVGVRQGSEVGFLHNLLSICACAHCCVYK